METNRYQRVKDVFGAVIDAPLDERTALLRQYCEGDQDLLNEVQTLLKHVDAPKVNIEKAAAAAQATLSSLAAKSRKPQVHAALAKPGDLFGGYRILGVLGEGGMGIVYLAEQDRPRRTVALKVVKPGYLSAGMLRRFEHETHVLGRLQHPGIAQIFEAGTADAGAGAQPYFAMEYVKGEPLLEYCNTRGMGTRQRLELLIRICDAVQHAHEQSVIHRDLKPANILVIESSAPSDGLKPACQPKILDFGIARSTDADIHTTTLRTDIGQLIGTIPYMSPEQVAGDPSKLDARSDIYALGVIGYELLTGRLPHDLRGKTIPEAVRIIGEHDPTPLSSVNKYFRGDLDTIISKALEREADRRYSTAADFAADVRRYLDDHPIVARPPSLIYQFQKFSKRNRAAVLAMAAVFLMLLASIVAVSIYAIQATIARDEALTLQKSESAAVKMATGNAARLAEQLAISNVERGRLLGFNGNIREAEDLLWPEHLRQPESPLTHWALWELYSREPCLATFKAQKASVVATVFSPDGRWLVTTGQDGTVSIWDGRTLKAIHSWKAHNRGVFGAAVSPDSATLVTGCDDGTVKLWRLPGGESAGELPTAKAPIRALAFAPDGRSLAYAGSEGIVRIHDMVENRLARELPAHKVLVTRVVYSPDGSTLASYGYDGKICIWQNAQGEPRVLQAESPMDSGRDFPAHANLQFTRDGQTLISGGGDQMVKTWDVASGTCTDTLSAPNGTVRFVAVSPDGGTIYAGGWWNIECWDVKSHQRRQPLSIPMSVLTGALSPDGMRLVAGFGDGLARVWDLAPDRGTLRLPGHEGRVAVAFNRDGSQIATADSSGTLRIWNAADGTLAREIQAHTRRIRTILFHPTQPLMFTSALDEHLKVWNTTTGELVRELPDHHCGTNAAVCISPDGKTLAYTTKMRSVTVVTWPECQPINTMLGPGRETLGICLSPDASKLVLCGRDASLTMWDVASGTLIATLVSDSDTPWTPVFSPDGKHLYVGAWGKNIMVFDGATGARLQTLVGHNGLVSEVQVRPDGGRMLASASADGSVKLWDTQTFQCLATLTGLEGWEAITCSFSPDGKRLAAAGRFGEAVIWDLEYYDRFIAGNMEYQQSRAGSASVAAR